MSATEEAAIPAGPDERVSITEGYARLVARDAFLWTWPLVNIYSRRLKFKDLPEAGLSGGIVPIAPSNRLSMLTDYIEPEERHVACPNQDVVYGLALLALDQSPMVVQVPDFGDRFWVYQIVDLRTDSFAFLGKMYGTPPAITCWWDPTGRATSRKASPASFGRPHKPACSSRACSRTMRRRTSRPCRTP